MLGNIKTRARVLKILRWISVNIKHRRLRGCFLTYNGEDERVDEVSVERQLHHVSPQPQQLHGLSQTHKDVTTQSRKITQSRNHISTNQ